MEMKYSSFTKERVFAVHEAVLTYLFERDEMEFWKMNDVLAHNKVAIPNKVYEVVQGFIDQYLELDLFGEIYSKKERVKVDLSDFEKLDVQCPNPEVGEDHVKWFQLSTIYDAISMKYIRPILFESEE